MIGKVMPPTCHSTMCYEKLIFWQMAKKHNAALKKTWEVNVDRKNDPK